MDEISTAKLSSPSKSLSSIMDILMHWVSSFNTHGSNTTDIFVVKFHLYNKNIKKTWQNSNFNNSTTIYTRKLAFFLFHKLT